MTYLHLSFRFFDLLLVLKLNAIDRLLFAVLCLLELLLDFLKVTLDLAQSLFKVILRFLLQWGYTSFILFFGVINLAIKISSNCVHVRDLGRQFLLHLLQFVSLNLQHAMHFFQLVVLLEHFPVLFLCTVYLLHFVGKLLLQLFDFALVLGLGALHVGVVIRLVLVLLRNALESFALLADTRAVRLL